MNDKIVRVTRTFKNHRKPWIVHCYATMKNRLTLREIFDLFTEEYPDIDPWSVELNFTSAVWDDEPTADEIAKWEEWERKQATRQDRWEREMYTKLKAKFEGTEQPEVTS